MAKKKILYIEDELSLATMVKDTLEIAGYEVLHLENGLGIIEKAKTFEPHIFVIDVMLPHKDGFTIGEELKKQFTNIPIIFLTAKSQVEDVIKGFDSGGNDYMKKPFSVKELIVRIENLTKHKPLQNIAKPTTIKLGQFEFNYTQLTLSNAETTQQLSFKESEILNMLCITLNQNVDRKAILLKVWGDDSYYNSRNLDVYIKKIRNYLSEDENINLKTLRGLGYKLVCGG